VPEGPSLYRRHRPRSFADVVGQEHVVQTLRHAIERDKVHHAYLFVGSRGTGKTSMAKILAACLNCERGPTVEPCGVCDSCVSIASATSLDVIEMDAASNNSVDDIRELREKVAYAPVSGRHKVYILDEAHMLSSQAWNAFLKTLEEPPPHTIFVLATTEAQKVLPTVVDRCHRFDFTRPSVEQISRVLRRVVEREGMTVPEEALALVARHATGSFRDALGTLEQLATYADLAGAGIAVADVLAVLGVADSELVFGALDAVAAHDARSALLAAAGLVDSGRDPGQLLRELETHARELLAVQVLGEVPAELRMTPERDERLAEQAARLGRQDVVRLLDLLAEALEATTNGGQARIQLELALVKAAAPEVDSSTHALLARIDRLEARLGGSAPPAIASVPEPSPAATPQPARPATPAPAPTPAAEPVPVPDPSPPPRPLPPAVAAVGVTAAPVVAPVREAVGDLEGIRAIWPAVTDTVRAENAMLAAALADARLTALAGAELVIAFAPSAAFHKRMAEGEQHRRIVAEALRTVGGTPLRPRYELLEVDDPAPEPADPAQSERELLARFVAEFDAEELPQDDDEKGGS
jgi:DNA polymerase III subunit gamma/tau